VTNVKRIKTALERKARSCPLPSLLFGFSFKACALQVNQICTVLVSIQLAQPQGYGVMVLHRRGETEDTFIANYVVALGVGWIKTSAPAHSERVAKYN